MELALNIRLTLDHKQIALADATPLGHAVLDDALRVIAQSRKGRTAQDWVIRLPKAVGGVRHRLLDDVVARGILARRNERILRMFPVTRYPEQQGQIEDELRARIDRAVLDHADADERTCCCSA